MTLRVRFAPEAQDEITEAARWYERRSVGVGLALVEAVDDVVAGITRWPHTGEFVPRIGTERELRRYSVRRFPYYVVCVISDEEVYVLAVAHNHRRPGYWSDRLEDM